MDERTREAIARIINPWAWEQFDAAVRPFAESRGAQDPYGREQFWYPLTYGVRGHRTVEDVRNWFLAENLEGQEPGAIFHVRESLTKADAILTTMAGDYVMVPREPTEAMWAAGKQAVNDQEPWSDLPEIWSAMLAASPTRGE